MARGFSYLLIALGLFLAGLGVKSVWSTYQAEREARDQWDREVAARSTRVRPSRKTNRGDLVARLSIGRLKSQWIVFEGAGKEDLERGPGHLVETVLPGVAGNCVIAGHRDTQFRVLRKVRIGEEISLEARGRNFVYRVIDRSVVAPTDTKCLDPTAAPILTLVTCYPFYYVGPAPKRFIIRAKLISQT